MALPTDSNEMCLLGWMHGVCVRVCVKYTGRISQCGCKGQRDNELNKFNARAAHTNCARRACVDCVSVSVCACGRRRRSLGQ